MKSKYFHCLAYKSFDNKFLAHYFNTLIIIKAFFTAILLSAFIFFETFNLTFAPLNACLAFCGFVFLFSSESRGFFWSGFFIGIFWFYWISFSFVHYGFSYLLPLGLLGVGLIYGLIFWASSLLHVNPLVKATCFFLLTLISPFGFNWFDIRLLFVNTHFAIDYLAIISFLLATVCYLTCKGKKKLFIIPLLLLALDGEHKQSPDLPFDVKLAQTKISQNDKWNPALRQQHIQRNLELIQKAIKNKKRLIILPESAFPLYLNQSPAIVAVLKDMSRDIAIISGALTYAENEFYNSTYLFDNGKIKIMHKVILVPFGEEVPLPSFLKTIINDIFYNGAKDFKVASSPQDFSIDAVEIRNAICFEATRKELHVKAPSFMIAISNNAWFMPSSEPIVQRLLLKMYATLHVKTIYHSVNGSKSEIIKQKISGPLGPLRELFFKSYKKFLSI